MWQVLSVIFSYAAFICDIILVITLIVFFIRYRKMMHTMLMVFITMNMSNSGIPSAKANHSMVIRSWDITTIPKGLSETLFGRF